MKKFILKLYLLSILVIGIYTIGVMIGQSFPPQYTNSFNASLLDKIKRVEKIKKSKIIIIGGSNIAFGIDSQLLQEEFLMPVVNMGVNAGMMAEFQLNIAQKYISKGDIVILGFEYGAYKSKKINQTTAWYTIENYSELWKCIPNSEKLSLLRFYPYYFGKKIIAFFKGGNQIPSNPEYIRTNFNEYGDFIFYREKNIRKNISQDMLIQTNEIQNSVIKKINKFCIEMKKRGATIYLTFPSLDESCIASNKKDIIEFEHKIKEIIFCPVISKIDTYIMPSKYFYDTAYHLNTHGAKLRTDLLILDIKNQLKLEKQYKNI